MGSNKRKVYGGGENGHGEAKCPTCGCGHFETIRATAAPDRVKIVKICRHCGREIVESA